MGTFTCSSERENTKMIFQAYEMEQTIGVLEGNYIRQVDKKIKCLIAPHRRNPRLKRNQPWVPTMIAPLTDRYSQDISLCL